MNWKSIILILAGIFIIGGSVYYLTLRGRVTQREPAKVYKIGVVRNPPGLDTAWEGFKKKMTELGYKEEENVTYIVIEVGKSPDETKVRISELITQNLDLLYTMGNIAAPAAKEVTAEKKPNLPVVFGIVSDPVGLKIAQSIKSSGNNMTGITPANEVVTSKRLALFKEMIPSLKRVIFPYNNPKSAGIEELRNAAKDVGVTLVEKQVKDAEDLKNYLDSLSFQKNDGLMRAPDSVSAVQVNKFAEVGIKKKVPTAGTNGFDVEQGVLMSYGADYRKIGEQAARLTDIILKGAKPADLPIERPEGYELVVNLKTASTIGVTISNSFLLKANKVIGR